MYRKTAQHVGQIGDGIRDRANGDVPDPDERADGKTALRDVKHANEQVENFEQPHTRFGERYHPAHRFRVMDHVFILFRKQTLMFLGKRLEQSEQPGDGVVVVKIFGKAFDARLRFLHARKGRVHLPGAPLVHEVKKRHPKQREQSHLKIVVEDVSQSEHDRKRDLDRGQHIDDDHLGNLVAIVEQARKQVPFLVPFKRRIRRFQHPLHPSFPVRLRDALHDLFLKHAKQIPGDRVAAAGRAKQQRVADKP